MDGSTDIVGKFVEGGKEAKKLSEPGADGNGEDGIPDEEFYDRCFGDIAFFPGDFGMKDVGDEDSGGSTDEAGEPEEIVVFDNQIGKNGVEAIIKNRNCDTDEDVTDGTFAGFDVCGSGGLLGGGTLVGFIG